MNWSTACPDWESRVLSGRSLIPFDRPFFPSEAEHALEIFRELPVKDVANSPPMGAVCREWIIDIVGHVFGSYDPDLGRRLLSEFFVLVSKKNAKSLTAAGIMLTALVRNWRESAEFLIVAPTIEVANNSFYPARDMVRMHDELRELFLIQEHSRIITHRTNNSMLKVVAADKDTVSGKKATGVFVDELWLFGNKSNAENMLREATGGLASRPEGFVIYCSTQSEEPPAGVFKQKLQYARDVRDGKIEDRKFLPVLYEFPTQMVKEKRFRDPTLFYVTNPNLGASVDVEFIEREAIKASIAGIDSEIGFYAKHLNVEIGIAMRADRWIGADYWEAQAVPAFTLAQLLNACEVVTIGIDGGGLEDLLGLCILGRVANTTDKFMAWFHCWAHAKLLKIRAEIAEQLKDFEKAGDLTIVHGEGEKISSDDIKQLGVFCGACYASGLLDTIGVDPAGSGIVVDAIKANDVPPEVIVGVRQGWSLTGTIKTTERRLAEGNLVHCGSDMMNWALGNAKCEVRGNSLIITKQASGRAKVDPLLALFDAMYPMERNPEARGNIEAALADPVIG